MPCKTKIAVRRVRRSVSCKAGQLSWQFSEPTLRLNDHYAVLTDVRIDLSHVAPRATGGALFLGIHEDDLFDEAQMASWIRQAAATPGWLQPGPDGKVQ
jgi:hypothetical protein